MTTLTLAAQARRVLTYSSSCNKCTFADDGVPSDGVGVPAMIVALVSAKRVGAGLQWHFSQTQKISRFCGGFHY